MDITVPFLIYLSYFAISGGYLLFQGAGSSKKVFFILFFGASLLSLPSGLVYGDFIHHLSGYFDLSDTINSELIISITFPLLFSFLFTAILYIFTKKIHCYKKIHTYMIIFLASSLSPFLILWFLINMSGGI